MEKNVRVALATADPRVVDVVESVAATLGLAVEVDDAAGPPRGWEAADVVLVGGDRAAAVASAGPRPRDRVYLVGYDAAALGTWSMALGAAVIPLPQGLAWLTAVLGSDTDADSELVAVLGGSGGVGASTLATGLALAGARRGWDTALVDLDAVGGGLDLLVGAEDDPGWRWPRLAGARGEVGDVRGVLPRVEGISLVSMARGGEPPPPDALRAVLGSLRRHHRLVVVDAGRRPDVLTRPVVQGADRVVLVAGSGVRQAAAAASSLAAWDVAGAVVAVHGVGAAAGAVADAVGAPLLGRVRHDRRLAARAEAGLPPGHPRGAWSRDLDRLLARLLEGERG